MSSDASEGISDQQIQSEGKTDEEKMCAVIFSDGSSKPSNPGFIGWGVHGYLYRCSDVPAKVPGMNSHIHTKKGYALVGSNNIAENVLPIKYIDMYGSSKEPGTNNGAEVDAVYHALFKLREYDVCCVQIYTDSEYARQGVMNWSKAWRARNWVKPDGSPVPNRRSWQRLVELVDEYERLGIDLKIDWVRGHKDNLGNIRADQLAAVAANHSMAGIAKNSCFVCDPKEYWKVDVERHPFLHFKRLYFNSLKQHNTLGHYYLTDSNSDELVIGKRSPDTSMAVIKLLNIDPVIETIREKQFEISEDINSVMLMRLDRVYSPDAYKSISEHGRHAMLTKRRFLGINFLDTTPITSEQQPSGLVLNAIDRFDLLETLLKRFEMIQENPSNPDIQNVTTEVHDISSVFYESEENLKRKTLVTKLKPEFTVGFKNLDVEVDITHQGGKKKIKVPIILGLDILPRNNLKGIETMSPKIYLLTWKDSDQTVCYATVVKVDNGIGIWSNFFANRLFLK